MKTRTVLIVGVALTIVASTWSSVQAIGIRIGIGLPYWYWRGSCSGVSASLLLRPVLLPVSLLLPVPVWIPVPAPVYVQPVPAYTQSGANAPTILSSIRYRSGAAYTSTADTDACADCSAAVIGSRTGGSDAAVEVVSKGQTHTAAVRNCLLPDGFWRVGAQIAPIGTEIGHLWTDFDPIFPYGLSGFLFQTACFQYETADFLGIDRGFVAYMFMIFAQAAGVLGNFAAWNVGKALTAQTAGSSRGP